MLRLEVWLGSAKENEETKRVREVEIERKSEKHTGREGEYRLRRGEVCKATFLSTNQPIFP